MIRRCLPLIGILLSVPAFAGDIAVTMYRLTADGKGAEIGSVTISQTSDGAAFALNLRGLVPGQHAFHVHQNNDCGPTIMGGTRIPAGAAGAHWDPGNTFKHAGPDGEGHLGDLPMIEAADNGSATQTLRATRIRDIDALKGHALVIQMREDSYSDTPPNGGGGGRIACGEIR